MNPLFRIDFSISDSLKIVRKSVLIYETIIDDATVVLMAKVLLMPAEESDSSVDKILNTIRCAYLVGFEQALETYNQAIAEQKRREES